MPEILRRLRPWLILSLKLAAAALVIWSVRRFLLGAFEQLRAHPVTIAPGWLCAAGAAYIAGMAPAAWYWHRVLARLGVDVSLYRTARAYWVGGLGKYVPGKGMVVAMRVALLPAPAGRVAQTIVSMVYETLSMIAVGAAIGGALVALLHPAQILLWLAGLAVAVASLVPLVPAVFIRVARIVRLDRRIPHLVEAVERLDVRELVSDWLVLAGGWLVLGLSLLATVAALGGSVDHFARDWATCTAVAGLSIAGGFVSMLPGGVGVREALIIPLLSPTYGEGVALAAAVLWRVVSVVAEIGLSAILYSIRGVPRS